MNRCATNNQDVSVEPGSATRLLYVSRRIVWGAVIATAIVSLPALISGLASPVLMPTLLSIACTVVAIELALRFRTSWNGEWSVSSSAMCSGFVADGYDRAIDGIEAQVRPEIEQKYAAERNRSGLIKRWLLKRRIEREISHRVAERAARISSDSLF